MIINICKYAEHWRRVGGTATHPPAEWVNRVRPNLFINLGEKALTEMLRFPKGSGYVMSVKLTWTKREG